MQLGEKNKFMFGVKAPFISFLYLTLKKVREIYCLTLIKKGLLPYYVYGVN